MSKEYDDIIDKEPPVSQKYPKMRREDRAAQFAPFAAMVGHDAMIAEAARYTERRHELDEDEKARLDKILLELCESEQPGEISVTYFKPDSRKEGGEYLTVCALFERADTDSGLLCLSGGVRIPINDVLDISVLAI